MIMCGYSVAFEQGSFFSLFIVNPLANWQHDRTPKPISDR